jgi:chromosome segregation ATPase
VRIRNVGPDAFKHDVYGDLIVIERKIVKDGSSSYKIRSKNGRI